MCQDQCRSVGNGQPLADFQIRLYLSVPLAVIPAQAGIYFSGRVLDSRLRGNDRPRSVLSEECGKPAATVYEGHSFQEIALVIFLELFVMHD
jgi:hypothetical protein